MLCLGPEALNTGAFNSARLLDEVWMFGMPEHSPEVMRNKIRVMQMQGSSYIKGLEGLKILPSEGLEVKRRGAEVRISREREGGEPINVMSATWQRGGGKNKLHCEC